MLPLQQVQIRNIRKTCIRVLPLLCKFVPDFEAQKLAEALTCLTYTQQVSGSNLGSNVNYPEVFVILIRISRKMTGCCLELYQGRFLPNVLLSLCTIRCHAGWATDSIITCTINK